MMERLDYLKNAKVIFGAAFTKRFESWFNISARTTPLSHLKITCDSPCDFAFARNWGWISGQGRWIYLAASYRNNCGLNYDSG